ncbi:MAG: hypothetical protein VB088_15605, partial [Sphaerochaeta sp.]|nr:hypothetical protein [Sphaerochaeta sp.]
AGFAHQAQRLAPADGQVHPVHGVERGLPAPGLFHGEVLLDALSRFEGTLMIVSHDRYFLKHLANRVFELDKGMLNIYEGDYAYYLHKSGRE